MTKPGLSRRSLAQVLATRAAAPALLFSGAKSLRAQEVKPEDEAAETVRRNAAAVASAVRETQIDPAFRFIP